MKNISSYYQKILNDIPLAPDMGHVKFYFRDNKWYYMKEDGEERELMKAEDIVNIINNAAENVTFTKEVTFEGDTNFQGDVTHEGNVEIDEQLLFTALGALAENDQGDLALQLLEGIDFVIKSGDEEIAKFMEDGIILSKVTKMNVPMSDITDPKHLVTLEYLQSAIAGIPVTSEYGIKHSQPNLSALNNVQGETEGELGVTRDTGNVYKWDGDSWEEFFNLNDGFTPNGSSISYDNSTSGLSATTIQGAIDELKALLGNNSGNFVKSMDGLATQNRVMTVAEYTALPTKEPTTIYYLI